MTNPSGVCKHGSMMQSCALCDALEELAELRPKTSTERVEKLRQERDTLGLRRRELYVHEDDWPELQELAAKLQRRRKRDAKSAKG